MSDQSTPAQGNPPATKEIPIENIKAEFDRKTTALSSQVQKLAETNATLMKQLEQFTKPLQSQQPKEKPLSDLLYDNPDEAVRIIEERAEQRVMSKIEQRETAQQRQAQTINELYSQYPELAQTDHELTKAALERYGKMGDEEKRDPKALKVAALEAAQELGIKPKSKRTDDDSFSFAGGNGSGNRSNRKSDKLDPMILETAAAFGLDTSKPEVVERLRARSQRTDYRRYQSGK